MKNPDYKSKEQLDKEWAELSEPERNVTLTIFVKGYSKRVITLLKQGNKLG